MTRLFVSFTDRHSHFQYAVLEFPPITTATDVEELHRHLEEDVTHGRVSLVAFHRLESPVDGEPATT
jgi:hypothetical protein